MQKEFEFISESISNDSQGHPDLLLILDTETTGLDINNDSCLEIGSILFHVSSRSVLAQNSFLIPVLSNPAESINKIPAEITRLPQPWLEGLNYFEKLVEASDVIVAHNAEFDRQWFGKNNLPAIEKKWICSMEEIAWPSDLQIRGRPSLRDLALAYEIPVWSAHRALTDCIYLAEVFRRCKDLEKLLIEALQPRRLMRAQVSYEERHLAKNAGFKWNDPVQGAWSRRLSEKQIKELSFQVVSVESNSLC